MLRVALYKPLRVGQRPDIPLVPADRQGASGEMGESHLPKELHTVGT